MAASFVAEIIDTSYILYVAIVIVAADMKENEKEDLELL